LISRMAAAASTVSPLAKYKIVFLGDQGVGKTSVITRFMYDKFESTYQVPNCSPLTPYSDDCDRATSEVRNTACTYSACVVGRSCPASRPGVAPRRPLGSISFRRRCISRTGLYGCNYGTQLVKNDSARSSPPIFAIPPSRSSYTTSATANHSSVWGRNAQPHHGAHVRARR